MIIAVDGPAGAGKSTVAKLVAKKLGFLYIDTGAMYRALTLKALEERVEIADADALCRLAQRTDIVLKNSENGTLAVLLDGRDVSLPIRQPHVSRCVSDVAKVRGVREVLVGLQRKLGLRQDSVIDGRDIGTAVFPDADRKFYLDAGIEERINRRYLELKGLGQEISPSEVAADLNNRDRIDSTRQVSPLKRAADAVYVDTTDMSIEAVVQALMAAIKHG